MALTCENNLDQETIRKAEQLKRIVGQRMEGEFRDMKLLVNFTGTNEPSTSRAKPGPSSRALDFQPSTSRVEPGPSSRALDQPSTSRVEPGPSSSRTLDPPASTSKSRTRPSSAIRTEESRPVAQPSLHAGIQAFIGLCSMPIRKCMTPSDVKNHPSRLVLPKPSMKKVLKHIRLKPNEDIKRGIPVTVYGPDGREYAMNFKLWCKTLFVLNTKSLNQFCQDYGLGNLINTATLTISDVSP